jgi:CheY-like chemotaxis protein
MTKNHGALAGRRTLIVEHEDLIAIAVEEEARLLGATDVLIAYQKDQALDAIERFAPAFVILDVSLTDDGRDYTIADALAKRGIPFIFSSGYLAGELPARHVGRPLVSKPMSLKNSPRPSRWRYPRESAHLLMPE